jgi:hypothetical protein
MTLTRYLAGIAAMCAGFALAILVDEVVLSNVAIFAGAWATAEIYRPRPRKPPEETRWIALERAFWVTGHDRIRCMDPRIIWLGKGKR